MVSWKLVAMGLVPLAGGAGIAYPVINSFNSVNSNKSIKLQSLEDFKQHCWVSISGGNKGYSGETNKKLLVCPSNLETTEASFYLYNESILGGKQLPREVESLKDESTELEENITFFLKKDNSSDLQNSEVVSVNNRNWKYLYNPQRNLKQDCNVDWKDSKKISCKGQAIRPELIKF